PRAREFALRALLLDGNLAEAHAALGAILTTYDYDFAKAETQYKRAIELNPNYATAYQWYGELMNYLGRHEESLAALRHGLEIDPQSLIINRIYGESLFFARRYNDAIDQHKRTIELDANFASVYGSLFSAYQGRGDHAESVEALARYYELNSNPRDAALVRDSFAKDGWQGFMRAMIGKRRPANFWSHIAAGFFAQLGENDKAFAELDSAYERRASQILLLKVDPRLDSLRDDPRFQELLKKVGFPE
ncbi:MAG: tetratricopeptide repeat protein, partial [Blastocatellia bacterium]|nr:tetratricopeptide repeat protein [Blastocatellia bacterium]